MQFATSPKHIVVSDRGQRSPLCTRSNVDRRHPQAIPVGACGPLHANCGAELMCHLIMMSPVGILLPLVRAILIETTIPSVLITNALVSPNTYINRDTSRADLIMQGIEDVGVIALNNGHRASLSYPCARRPSCLEFAVSGTSP